MLPEYSIHTISTSTRFHSHNSSPLDGQRYGDGRVLAIAQTQMYVFNFFLLGSGVCISMQLRTIVSVTHEYQNDEEESQNPDDLL